MQPDFRSWHLTVVVVGLGGAVTAGILAVPGLGVADAAVWTALLTYVFALAYAANRLQVWLARPPVALWKAAFLGAAAFIPMFFGWFPVSNWTMEMGRIHSYQYVPSPFWILGLMLWGLFAPGGVIAEVVRRWLGKTG